VDIFPLITPVHGRVLTVGNKIKRKEKRHLGILQKLFTWDFPKIEIFLAVVLLQLVLPFDLNSCCLYDV